MILGAVLIVISWLYFGGPCKVSLFFKIPGGSVTIVLYYVLWTVIFALAGAEAVMMHRFCNGRSRDNTFLYHVAAHLCLLLWYPLFFTTFSQFLSLLIIIAALVLLILEFKLISRFSCLISATVLAKVIVVAVFAYINLSFLIIN